GELADAAGAIERTGDPRRRLPQPQTRDEVGRLATTLNAMLGSLERARESERRFLADASHELRTPLTALRGNVAYLVRHGATPEPRGRPDHGRGRAGGRPRAPERDRRGPRPATVRGRAGLRALLAPAGRRAGVRPRPGDRRRDGRAARRSRLRRGLPLHDRA